MWFTRVSINNPVMATMVMLAFVVLGLFSYQRLKVDQFPNIEFPVVVVQVDYPGASPEIVESEVTRPIEEAVNTIAGINQLYSRSYDSTSVVVIQFNLEIDGRKAADDVREKVSAVKPLLRTEVKDPRVLRFDPASRPVFSVALTSPAGSMPGTAAGQRSQVDLTTFADQVLKKRLENANGVGAVTLVGALKREINIYLKPDAMEAMGVGIDQVVGAVRTENRELPAGALRSRDSERVVQINGRLRNPQDFNAMIVARRGGNVVRLDQLADIKDGPQEIESAALFNGQRTLVLSVQKAEGENTIEVVDGLRRALASVQQELPAGMKVDVVHDVSRPIRVAVANVRETLFEGAILTIAIVFLFLNSWRSTVITGLTLPISAIGTFLFMYLFGFTINMITLMALSLCVGLLIDDAIVVRENIVRHAQMGKSPRQAALDGTNEIGLAVLATTLSIVAVFLPIGFMGGIIGKFFHEFGITIVSAVLISMFVSFTLDPMLSSIWRDPAIELDSKGTGETAENGKRRRESLYDRTIGRVTGAVDRFSHRLGDAYQRILGWSLRHKLATLVIALATFIASFFIVPILGAEFVPKADYSETYVNFYTPVGSSLEVTEAKARQVDTILREFPEVNYTLTTINSGQAQGKMYASMFIRLKDRNLRTRSEAVLSPLFRERLLRVPGMTVTHVGLLDAVGGQKPIQVSFQGIDLKELERLTALLADKLRAIPGLVDLDTSMKPNKPIVAIDVKREAASDLGLGVGAITDSLRSLIAGDTIGNWRAPDDQNYDVKVRLSPEARDSVSDLQRLPLVVPPAADGSVRVVRLSQVADIRSSTGANQINRRDLNREVEITANASGRSVGEISADIRKVLDETGFPPGYRFRFGGSTKDMEEAFGYALSALGLAVVFIYMILASQFKSFLQPLALMSSLPLTLIGVVSTLLLFGSTINMFSIIGVVMLMGLVTKNAILLIDFAIRSRQGEQGDHGGVAAVPMDRERALMHAARVRLRPILMTTLAMIFGMVPLAFALSEGAEQRSPMGQAVIGGVITSSLLTLVVVPVIYCYLDDLAEWLKRRFRPSAEAIGKPASPDLAAESTK